MDVGRYHASRNPLSQRRATRDRADPIHGSHDSLLSNYYRRSQDLHQSVVARLRNEAPSHMETLRTGVRGEQQVRGREMRRLGRAEVGNSGDRQRIAEAITCLSTEFPTDLTDPVSD